MPTEQYEHVWKDYYEVLQVHPKAEAEIISAAYRKLAFLYHPDRNHQAGATERLKVLNEAYAVLSNSDRRHRYDRAYASRTSDTWHGTRDSEQSTSQDDSRDAHDSSESWDPTEEDEEEQEFWYEQPDVSYKAPYEAPQGRWARAKAWIEPGPDEKPAVFPWPSWNAQRSLLIGTIPLGALLFIVGIANAAQAWALIILGLALGGAALYAGIATRWMESPATAPRQARIAAGSSIVVSGVTYGLAAMYAVVMIVIGAFMLTVLVAAGKSALEDAMKGK